MAVVASGVPIFWSLYEGSYDFGSILGAPDFWKFSYELGGLFIMVRRSGYNFGPLLWSTSQCRSPNMYFQHAWES